MKQYQSLIKKEFLEYKGSVFKTPLILACFLILVSQLFSSNFSGLKLIYQLKIERNELSELGAFYIYLSYFVSFPFFVLLFFTQLNYFSHTLFGDRQDRSVLFWKSMPVSDLKSIITKFIFGLICTPLLSCFFSFCTASCLLFLFSFSIPPEVFSYFNFVNYLSYFFNSTLSLFYFILWAFPIYSWALLCSAYAKKSPFIMTIFFPFLLVFIEFIVMGSKSYILNFMFLLIKNLNQNRLSFSLETMNELIFSLLVGFSFTVLALTLRHRCFRFDVS